MSVNTFHILRCDRCGETVKISEDSMALLMPPLWRTISLREPDHSSMHRHQLCAQCSNELMAFIAGVDIDTTPCVNADREKLRTLRYFAMIIRNSAETLRRSSSTLKSNADIDEAGESLSMLAEAELLDGKVATLDQEALQLETEAALLIAKIDGETEFGPLDTKGANDAD